MNAYVFDYDLTFAVLLMNGDGTVYHRYGSRDHTSATSMLSMKSLVRVMKESVADHERYQRSPQPPPPVPKRTIEDFPTMARKLQKQKIDCMHCHMVNGEEYDSARAAGKFSREAVVGRWPLPERVGLRLEVDDQARVKEVIPGSPAARAGIAVGDKLLRVGAQGILTQSDVQWALHQASPDATAIPVEVLHEADMVKLAKLELAKGWKVASDLAFSWRSSMWNLRPLPGFGGRKLAGTELEQLGLPAGAFALKVGYIVDWGDDANTGRNVRAAGIKGGDVILSVAGKSDFVTELHFQSWFRFTQKPGAKVPIEILRDGKRSTIELPVLE